MYAATLSKGNEPHVHSHHRSSPGRAHHRAGGTALALPLHVTDPDATRLMADLINDIDVLTAADVAETVAFIASVPRHVNLTEITILPTQQAA